MFIVNIGYIFLFFSYQLTDEEPQCGNTVFNVFKPITYFTNLWHSLDLQYSIVQ